MSSVCSTLASKDLFNFIARFCCKFIIETCLEYLCIIRREKQYKYNYRCIYIQALIFDH